MNISLNSKAINNGDIFVALQGSQFHGAKFAPEAIKNGATTIISDKKIKSSVPVIVDKDLNNNLAKLANQYYPKAKGRRIIAITGTNGKTSVASFIAQILTNLAEKNQVIGTLNGDNTTPDIFTLYQKLHNFDGLTILEVSSHSLVQKRTKGLIFELTIWTNLSSDHLDYHQNMDNYLKAKLLITKQTKFGIFNSDDKFYPQFSSQLIHDNYSLKNIEYKIKKFGFLCKIENIVFETNLLGEFNLYNILASYKALLKLGFKSLDIFKNIAVLQVPLGRMQKIENNNIWIDFAHTKDGLKQAINALKQHYPQNKITVIFGCGGNRDQSKRAKMGKVANDLADRIILTNDNPRDENPQIIIDDILQGINKKTQVILNRELAIEAGISNIKEDECILITGKGHENYQIIGNKKIKFNDFDIVKRRLSLLGGSASYQN